MAAVAGISTWIMVIFKPDGSHGMYSWLHFWIATGCALAAWYALYRAPDLRTRPGETPADEPAAPLDMGTKDPH